MESNAAPQPDITQAASQIASKPADAIQGGKPKRTRAPRQPKTEQIPPAQPPAGTQVVQFHVNAQDLRKAFGPFLRQVAAATRTRPPEAEEIDALAEGTAQGLNHTKLVLDEKTGPWVPLSIAVTAYMVPRAVEALMTYMERKQREAEAAETPAQGFRPRLAEVGELAEDGGSPVPAVGVAPEA